MKQYEIKKKTQNFRIPLIFLILTLFLVPVGSGIVANSSTYTLNDAIQSLDAGVNPINLTYQIDNQNNFFYEYYENPPNPNPTPFPNSTNWGSPVDATSNLKYEDGIYETTIAPSVLHKAAGTYQLFEFNVGVIPSTDGNISIKLKYDGAQPANLSNISIWNQTGHQWEVIATFNGTNILYLVNLTDSQINNMLDDGTLYFAASATKDNNVGGIVLSTDYVKLELSSGSEFGFRTTQHYQQPVGFFESENNTYSGALRWLGSVREILEPMILVFQHCSVDNQSLVTDTIFRYNNVDILLSSVESDCFQGCGENQGTCVETTTVFKFSGTLLLAFAILTIFCLWMSKKLKREELRFFFLIMAIIAMMAELYQASVTGIGILANYTVISDPIFKVAIALGYFLIFVLTLYFLAYLKDAIKFMNSSGRRLK